jgi:hypothetical protein
MNGIVNGGWNFVIAAYGITALVLVTYCARVLGSFKSYRGK